MFWSYSVVEENCEEWFVDIENNMLFKKAKDSVWIEFVSQIPGGIRAGANPVCVKYKEKIYCLPEYAHTIFIYNLAGKGWEKIDVQDVRQGKAGMRCAWICDKQLIVYSWNCGSIYKINLESNCIDGCYSFKELNEEILRTHAEKVGDSIFFISAIRAVVYEFNVVTEKLNIYELPIEEKICPFTTDGNLFYFGTFEKKIYIWNKKKNTVEIISQFTEGFDAYKFGNSNKNQQIRDEKLFWAGICIVDNEVWYIPRTANKILYHKKGEMKFKCFEIENERETKETLKRSRKEKYVVNYVRDNRYIGIYSFQNDCIYEIDASNKTMKENRWRIDDKNLNEITRNMMESGKIFCESSISDCYLYRKYIEANI